jgi:hypothetical protein
MPRRSEYQYNFAAPVRRFDDDPEEYLASIAPLGVAGRTNGALLFGKGQKTGMFWKSASSGHLRTLRETKNT